MASLNRCPGCGRTLRKSLLGGAYFNIYTCRDCGKKSCEKCGGKRCPSCGSGKYNTYDKVYAR